MPAVRSLANQYPGINAHLHSLWQAEGGWNSFHSSHLIHLLTLMKAQLRPMGYTADVEQSLQIECNEQTETQYRAVAIRQSALGQRGQGDIVAWVELLSPSNKPGGQDAEYYDNKRLKVLEVGTVLVEMDFLHESPPTVRGIPKYRPAGRNPQPEPNSRPYRIAVIDPRPIFWEGLGRISEFDVDRPIPALKIPLNGTDVFEFDFGAAYRKTFEEVLYGDEVDYRRLPLNFDRYSQADQTRIARRMLAVLRAASAGVDLESAAPLPTEPLSLEEALAQIETWNAEND